MKLNVKNEINVGDRVEVITDKYGHEYLGMVGHVDPITMKEDGLHYTVCFDAGGCLHCRFADLKLIEEIELTSSYSGALHFETSLNIDLDDRLSISFTLGDNVISFTPEEVMRLADKFKRIL